MPRYHCSIPKTDKGPAFNFTAFQYGPDELPEAVGVATLERKVSPGLREYDREESVEIVAPDGKTSKVERVRTRVRERVSQLAMGRAVNRNKLEVEAGSPGEAEAIYRAAIGVNPEGTSRRIHVVLAEESPAADTTTTPQKGKAKRKPTADEAANALLGGRGLIEE